MVPTTVDFFYCVVPEKIHTHPIKGHWKFLVGGGWALEAKFLEAMYENKLEFPGGRGRGVQNKNPSVGGVWIFSVTAHCSRPVASRGYL